MKLSGAPRILEIRPSPNTQGVITFNEEETARVDCVFSDGFPPSKAKWTLHGKHISTVTSTSSRNGAEVRKISVEDLLLKKKFITQKYHSVLSIAHKSCLKDVFCILTSSLLNYCTHCEVLLHIYNRKFGLYRIIGALLPKTRLKSKINQLKSIKTPHRIFQEVGKPTTSKFLHYCSIMLSF